MLGAIKGLRDQAGDACDALSRSTKK